MKYVMPLNFLSPAPNVRDLSHYANYCTCV